MRGPTGGGDGAGGGQDEHAGGDARTRPYRFMVGAYRCSCRLYSRTWAAIPGGGGTPPPLEFVWDRFSSNLPPTLPRAYPGFSEGGGEICQTS